jgi:hypothetical protein
VRKSTKAFNEESWSPSWKSIWKSTAYRA